MLPNWLYGKSKSKLASILGGGGTPADYNQVKAQVNQNTEDITGLLDNLKVNGVVNMLNFDKDSQTIKGYTFTNTDGVIQVTGSRTSGETGNVDFYANITLPKGSYKVSGCPSGGGDDTWRLLVNINNGAKYAFDYGDGAVFTLTEESTLKVYCTIMANYSDTVNLTFEPMIAVPSYKGPYVPPAKSNRELTEDVAVKKLTFTDFFTLASGYSLSHQDLRKVANGYSIQATIQGSLNIGRNAVATMSTVIGTATEEMFFGSGRCLDSNSIYHPVSVGMPIKANAELAVYTDIAITNGYCTFSMIIPF